MEESLTCFIGFNCLLMKHKTYKKQTFGSKNVKRRIKCDELWPEHLTNICSHCLVYWYNHEFELPTLQRSRFYFYSFFFHLFVIILEHTVNIALHRFHALHGDTFLHVSLDPEPLNAGQALTCSQLSWHPAPSLTARYNNHSLMLLFFFFFTGHTKLALFHTHTHAQNQFQALICYLFSPCVHQPAIGAFISSFYARKNCSPEDIYGRIYLDQILNSGVNKAEKQHKKQNLRLLWSLEEEAARFTPSVNVSCRSGHVEPAHGPNRAPSLKDALCSRAWWFPNPSILIRHCT